MTMKRYILAFAAATLFVLPAIAQEINHTVEVTNAYEGAVTDIRKPERTMSIPDSVTRFNLDFDYSVFDNPYKGSYEFRPYLVTMKPQRTYSDASTLYVKAGLGYTFRPEAQIIWTPTLKNGLLSDIHASHTSYYGRYWNMDTGNYSADGDLLYTRKSTFHDGFDMENNVGADFGFSWGKGSATISADYIGIGAKSPDALLQHHSGKVAVHVASNTLEDKTFLYDVNTSVRYGVGPFPEFRYKLDASAGPSLNEHNTILVDLSADYANVDGGGFSAGVVSVMPKYRLTLSGIDLWVGVKLSLDFNKLDWTGNYSFHKTYQPIFPMVKARYALIRDKLSVFASLTGGRTLNTPTDLVEMRHFVVMDEARYASGVSVERFNARIGFEGNLFSRFQYSLSGGFAGIADGLVDAIVTPAASTAPVPSLMTASYGLAYADGKFALNRSGFGLDGTVRVRYATLDAVNAVKPALLSGHARVWYNWFDRIKAGLTGEFATDRVGTDGTVEFRIPAWFDLGAFAEYNVGNYGLWLRGGNLLNRTIQRNPLIAERGIYVTGGIRVNF